MKGEFLHAGAKAGAGDKYRDDPFEASEKEQASKAAAGAQERNEKEMEAKASSGAQEHDQKEMQQKNNAREISSKIQPGAGGGGGGSTDGGGGGIHLSSKTKHILTIVGYAVAGIVGFLLLCACCGHYAQKKEAAKASLKAPLMTS